jgi:VWFA-related protein
MSQILKKPVLFVLAIPTLSSLLAWQQKEQGLQPQEKYEVEVRLIPVDVIATKNGEFFPGLKKEDFELFEDGIKVPINSCDLISLGTSALKLTEQKAPIVPDIIEKKRLAVLFDGINAWDREFKKAAQEIAEELASLAKSGMDVMILSMDSQKGLRILQPFTDQEAIIRSAAAKVRGEVFSPFLEYLDYDQALFAGGYTDEDAKRSGIHGETSGKIPILEMRNLEHTNIATDKLTRTIGGLLASLHMLGSLPGRKNLLFISSGIPDFDAFQRDNVAESLRLKGQMQAPTSGRISIFDPFGILGKKVFETGEEVLKEIIRVANDRNISIYSIDPGIFSKNVFAGPSAQYFDRDTAASQKTLLDEKSRQIQNLRMISEKTGAALLRGAKKIESFRQVVRNDLSYYYQLSYYPPRKKGDTGYHKIEVKVKGRKGIEIRSREGYSDSSPKQSQRLVLAKAFYNPEAFLDKLPFKAEFVPFFSDSGKYEPWMSLALPAREFFIDQFTGFGKKTYEFHFWIKEEEGSDRVLAGNVTIPFDIDPSFKERLASEDYLRLYFVGPGIELGENRHHVVFALFDPETGEVGTWSSDFPRPFSKRDKEPAFVNAILGSASAAEDKRGESFLLNGKDGTLEFGQLKFSPKIIGRFSTAEDIYIFFQVYNPEGATLEPKFEVTDKAGLQQRINGERVAESWNKASRVWSGAFKLNIGSIATGDYDLKIEIPTLAAVPTLTRKMKLTIY